jgi:dolichol-phosphate mannosyltransferase
MEWEEEVETCGCLTHSEIAIIIPTKDEVENIGELMARIRAVTEVQVVFVDDNSRDGTYERLKEITRTDKSVFVIERRRGKGGIIGAIRTALSYVRCDFVVIMDADLQHRPEDLPKIINGLLEGIDVVIGSRYVKGGSHEFTFMRKLISRGAIILAHVLLSKTREIKDPMSGFFGFKREIIRSEDLSNRGFKILLEILVKGNYRSVLEVPIKFESRRKGASKLKGKTIFNYIKHILALALS